MTAVLMFAKAPRPGLVKTRLTREVGASQAVSIYRAVGRSVAAAISQRYPISVWYDPPDAAAEMRNWLGAHEYLPQAEGDLGRRMQHAFAAHHERGDGPMIAIGADAPEVDAAVIHAAEAVLSRYEVVLGPACDGGYYLIGLNRPIPELFEGVPWGTPRVRHVTLEICAKLHLGVGQTEKLRDVDTGADAEAFGLLRT
jgi:rSAM/selenodomain-associated transferase 1